MRLCGAVEVDPHSISTFDTR